VQLSPKEVRISLKNSRFPVHFQALEGDSVALAYRMKLGGAHVESIDMETGCVGLDGGSLRWENVWSGEEPVKLDANIGMTNLVGDTSGFDLLFNTSKSAENRLDLVFEVNLPSLMTEKSALAIQKWLDTRPTQTSTGTPSNRLPHKSDVERWARNRNVTYSMDEDGMTVSVTSISGDRRDAFVLGYVFSVVRDEPRAFSFYYKNSTTIEWYANAETKLWGFYQFSRLTPLEKTTHRMPASNLSWHIEATDYKDNNGVRLVQVRMVGQDKDVRVVQSYTVGGEEGRTEQGHVVDAVTVGVQVRLERFPYTLNESRVSLFYETRVGEAAHLVNGSSVQFGPHGFQLNWVDRNMDPSESQMCGVFHYHIVPNAPPLSALTIWDAALTFDILSRTPWVGDEEGELTDPFTRTDTFKNASEGDLRFTWEKSKASGTLTYVGRSPIDGVEDRLVVRHNAVWGGVQIAYQTNESVSFLSDLVMESVCFQSTPAVCYYPTSNRSDFRFKQSQVSFSEGHAFHSYILSQTLRRHEARFATVVVETTVRLASQPVTVDGVLYSPNQISINIENRQFEPSAPNTAVVYNFILGGAEVEYVRLEEAQVSLDGATLSWKSEEDATGLNVRLTSSSFVGDFEKLAVTFNSSEQCSLDLVFDLHLSSLMSAKSVHAIKSFFATPDTTSSVDTDTETASLLPSTTAVSATSTSTASPQPTFTSLNATYTPPTPLQVASWAAHRNLSVYVNKTMHFVSVLSTSTDPADPYVLAFILVADPLPVLYSLYYMNVPPFNVRANVEAELAYLVEYTPDTPMEQSNYFTPTWTLGEWELLADSFKDNGTGATVVNITFTATKKLFSLYNDPDKPTQVSLSATLSSIPLQLGDRNFTPTALSLSFSTYNFPYADSNGQLSLVYHVSMGELPFFINNSCIQYGGNGYLWTWNSTMDLEPFLFGTEFFFVAIQNKNPLSKYVRWDSTFALDLVTATIDSVPSSDPMLSDPLLQSHLNAFTYSLNVSVSRSQLSLFGRSPYLPNIDYLHVLHNWYAQTIHIAYRTTQRIAFLANFELLSVRFTTPSGAPLSFWLNPWNPQVNISLGKYEDPVSHATLIFLTYQRTFAFYNTTFVDARNITVNMTVYLATEPITYQGVRFAPNQIRVVCSNSDLPRVFGRRGSVSYTIRMGGQKMTGFSNKDHIISLAGGSIDWSQPLNQPDSVRTDIASYALNDFSINNEVNTVLVDFKGPGQTQNLTVNFNLDLPKLVSEDAVQKLKLYLLTGNTGELNPTSTATASATESTRVSATPSATLATPDSNQTTQVMVFTRTYVDNSTSTKNLNRTELFNRTVSCNQTTMGFTCRSRNNVSSIYNLQSILFEFSTTPHPSFRVSHLSHANVSDTMGRVLSTYRLDLVAVVEFNDTIRSSVSKSKMNFRDMEARIAKTPVIETHSDGSTTFQFKGRYTSLTHYCQFSIFVHDRPTNRTMFTSESVQYVFPSLPEGMTFLFEPVFTSTYANSHLAFQHVVYSNISRMNITYFQPNNGLLPVDTSQRHLLRILPKAVVMDAQYHPKARNTSLGTFIPSPVVAPVGSNSSGCQVVVSNVPKYKDTLLVAYGGEVGIDLATLTIGPHKNIQQNKANTHTASWLTIYTTMGLLRLWFILFM
jgi:hypothetical protein